MPLELLFDMIKNSQGVVKLIKFSLLLWMIGFISGILIGSFQGNGHSPALVLPIFLTGIRSQKQQDWVKLLIPHLKWYDRIFIVGIVPVTDYVEIGSYLDYWYKSIEERPPKDYEAEG